MATIKFSIQSNSSSAPIYARFSHGREISIKRRTGLSIDSKSWSKTTGLPITRDEYTKSIKFKLEQLKLDVLNSFNDSNSKGLIIDGLWLERSIDKSFNRNQEVDLDYLINYCDHYLLKRQQKLSTSDNLAADTATFRKYRTVINKLKSFELRKGKSHLLKDVDLDFRDKFLQFLLEQVGHNTAGRYLKFVKTIILDAKRNGLEVSNQLDSFKGYTRRSPIVILSLEELHKIIVLEFENERYETTRDWLIIGFYTGQRVSDLLRMNKAMIEKINSLDFIVIRQKKTKKVVHIPIHPEVKKILNKRNGDFPPLFTQNLDSNKSMFNRYLKQICKEAEIKNLVEGNAVDPEGKEGRKKIGNYEKWKLVSSHICRRSFASHFYGKPGYSTPLLMNVTAHSSEKQFLEYIGKPPIDYSIELGRIWQDLPNSN